MSENAHNARVILMADDDSDDRLLAEEALQESGSPMKMRFVEDGMQMMDYLRRRNEFKNPADSPRPDLIFLDLNMPVMDGREVLKEIKNDPQLKRIPVVVLTTSNSDTDIAYVYQTGANSFITKPTAFNALVGVMKSINDYWFSQVMLPGKVG